jgi:hypothetical protein
MYDPSMNEGSVAMRMMDAMFMTIGKMKLPRAIRKSVLIVESKLLLLSWKVPGFRQAYNLYKKYTEA